MTPEQLVEVTANLQKHIDERAAEFARPLINAARAEAAEKVRAAMAEARRQEDLVAELRRQIVHVERIGTEVKRLREFRTFVAARVRDVLDERISQSVAIAEIGNHPGAGGIWAARVVPITPCGTCGLSLPADHTCGGGGNG